MQLVKLNGPETGRAISLSDGQAASVGRSELVDIHVPDSAVSRLHCLIEVDGGRVFVSDHDSRTGTFVNGKLVTKQELSPGDVLRIGQTRFRFELDQAPEVSTSLSTQDVPPNFDERFDGVAKNSEIIGARRTAGK